MLVAIVSCLLAFAADARGAGKGESALTIVSPATRQLVTGREVAVRVKVASGVDHLKVTVAGRRLRLRPGGNDGLLVATARRSALAAAGPVLIEATGRRHGRTVSTIDSVVLGRRRPALLRAVRLPARASGSARLRFRLGGTISQFAVSVNGHKMRTLIRPRRAGPASIPLSADDGLHRGRNRIIVFVSHSQNGSWARAVRTLRISRRAPLVAAGADRSVTAGTTFRLDGENSSPAHRGERLHYRWHILSQPGRRGSGRSARLLNPRAVQPRLTVHRPGVYKVGLELAATEAAHPTSADGTARASVAEDPPASSPIEDVTTVEAAEPVPPYGLNLWTLQEGAPEELAGGEYEVPATKTTIEGVALGPGGSDSYESPFESVQMIVLMRSTLKVKETTYFPPGEVEKAVNAAKKVEAGELAIVSSGTRSTEGGGGTVKGEPEIGEGDAFTLIASGGVVIDYNVERSSQEEHPGAIHGVLRQSAGGLFNFQYTEAVPFDTCVECTEQVTEMSVGNETFTVTKEGGKGIGITVVNSALKSPTTYDYPLKGNSEDTATLERLAAKLGELSAASGTVLLLQTYGDPKNELPTWSAVGQQLEKFGGTPSVWDELAGQGDYALVGTAQPGQNDPVSHAASTAEASGQLEGGPAAEELARWVGTLRGVLGRGPDGLPMVRSSMSLPNGSATVEEKTTVYTPYELFTLAEAEPEPWPLSDPAHEAALAWISNKMGLGQPGDDKISQGWCFSPQIADLRAEYCNKTLKGEWGKTELDALEAVGTPTTEVDFTPQQEAEVVEELKTEFTQIGRVQNLVADLKEPWVEAKSADLAGFLLGAGKVAREVDSPEQETNFKLMGAIFDGVLTPAQNLEFDAPEEAAEAGATDGASLIFGVLEAALNFGLSFAETKTEKPAASPLNYRKNEQVVAAAQERVEASVESIGRLEALLLSDPHKLRVAYERAANAWSIAEGVQRRITDNAEAGALGWFYEALVPASYGEIQVTPTEGLSLKDLQTLECSIALGQDGSEEWKPFEDVSPYGYFEPKAAGHLWVIGNPANRVAQVPTRTLTEELFKAPEAKKSPIMYAAPFFTWSWIGPDRRTIFSEYFGNKKNREGFGEPGGCQGE